jgi:hypothetical protein
MRTQHGGALIVVAAFCFATALLIVAADFLFVAPLRRDGGFDPRGPTVATLVAVAGVSSLIAAFRRVPRNEHAWLVASSRRWFTVAAAASISAIAMFGGWSGFHHHYGFGFPILYMVWNGEDPDPRYFQIVDGHEVGFDPLAFGVLFCMWAAIVGLTVFLLRPATVNDSAKL